MSEKMNVSTALLPSSSEVVGDFILDDSSEDGCSICLEPFTFLEPALVTKCQHEYHMQCIIDWSQRSSQCPVCMQHLVSNDPTSQEMIAAAERERKLRQNPACQENESRVVSMIARVISRRRRPSAPRYIPRCFTFIDSDSLPPTVHIDSRYKIGLIHGNALLLHFPLLLTTPVSSHGRPRPTEFAAISNSFKSKLSTASVRYRESLSKGTRSLKEKIMAQNDSVKELRREVQRIAGIVRQIARKRAGLCVRSGASHYRRIEDDLKVEDMTSNSTNAVAQEA